jgi:hypothetical protein
MINQMTNQLNNVSVDRINIENIDGLDYLKKIDDNSIDLILTDPLILYQKILV